MRLAGFESQAQRLARAEEMLLADDFVDRARAQGLGERCQRLLLAEKIVHCSPNTSTPFGGTKRNCAGSTFGLRTRLKKRSKVV